LSIIDSLVIILSLFILSQLWVRKQCIEGAVDEVGDTGGIEEVPGWMEDSENKGSTSFFLLYIEGAADGVGDTGAIEGVPRWMKDSGFFTSI